jgi:hypothetical protein
MNDMQQFYEWMQAQDVRLPLYQALLQLANAAVDRLRKLQGQGDWTAW